MHQKTLRLQKPTSLPQHFTPFKTDNFIVGITGGIGSGKTAVTNWFSNKGIDVVDADVIAHQIMQKDSPALQLLVRAFGDWVIDDKGEMDRQAVREHVFANDSALLTLEEITHPAIRQTIKTELLGATSAYVILSAPLLLESNEGGLSALCDRILVVDVAEETQLLRAGRRDNQSYEQITAVMANQMLRQERLNHAHDIINNDGNLEDLYVQLDKLHDKYLQLSRQKQSKNTN